MKCNVLIGYFSFKEIHQKQCDLIWRMAIPLHCQNDVNRHRDDHSATKCTSGSMCVESRVKFKFIIKMTQNLISLAKECPGLQVTITLSDLIEANTALIADTKRELEQLITDQNAETYPSREKVMEMLDVSQATLWRWAKNGYLVPLNVGGKRRYKMSDVKRILEGNNAQKGVAV